MRILFSAPGTDVWLADKSRCIFLNESFCSDKDPVFLMALERTAKVLAEKGGLGPYSGHCLSIDANGSVSMSPPSVKY